MSRVIIIKEISVFIKYNMKCLDCGWFRKRRSSRSFLKDVIGFCDLNETSLHEDILTNGTVCRKFGSPQRVEEIKIYDRLIARAW